jgi:hypothetical protein
VWVAASPESRAFIGERGGQLFVWPDVHRCCRGTLTLLSTSTDPPPRALEFTKVDAAGFTLFLHPSMRRLPEEMELSLRGRGRRRHVEAYWDGCIYAI